MKSSDFDEIQDNARRAGWVIDRTSGGRLRFTHPEVAFPIFTGVNPSEFRSLRNLESALTRALRKHVPEPEVIDVRPKKKKKKPVSSSPVPGFVRIVQDAPEVRNVAGWKPLVSMQERYTRASAWRLAVLRMRVVTNREWSDIIALRSRFKTDSNYQRQLVVAWVNATKLGNDDVDALRKRLRYRGQIARAISRFRGSPLRAAPTHAVSLEDQSEDQHI
jgi:hypothetical protein